MGKYTSNKRRLGWFGRFLLIIFLLVLLLFGLVAGYIWSKLDKITYADEIPSESISDNFEDQIEASDDEYIVEIDDLDSVEVPSTIPDSQVNKNDAVLNILLIGTDERTTHYNTNARADSMILVSINKEKHTVKLVSLERGIGVPILDGKYKGEYDLLTHIFRWGGADLLIQTVEHCFKIECDRYVRLNFAAVKDIVDTVGGIDVSLDASEVGYLGLFIDLYTSTGKQQPLRVGVNHLDGGTALAYARLREIDSDWQRVGRQRKVILAVVDAVKGSTLGELDDLADTVLPLIQTNLTKFEITELILYAPNFITSEFDQMTIPKQGTYGGMNIRNGGGAFAVDYEINNAILQEFLYGDATSKELLGN